MVATVAWADAVAGAIRPGVTEVADALVGFHVAFSMTRTVLRACRNGAIRAGKSWRAFAGSV